MEKKRIIISINFNAWAHPQYKDKRLSKEWIEDRIAVFMKFTYRSLKQQTNQNYITLIRYADRSENIVKQALLKYEKLPENIQFVRNSEYKGHVKKNSTDYDITYSVRLDSDDMYHKTFVQQLHDYKPKENTAVLLCQKGYLYDSVNHRLTTTFRLSPPFYAFIKKNENKTKENKTKEKGHSLKGGHSVVQQLPHEILDRFNYMIVVHSHNVHTQFIPRNSHSVKNSPDIMEAPREINTILRDFMGKV